MEGQKVRNKFFVEEGWGDAFCKLNNWNQEGLYTPQLKIPMKAIGLLIFF
jgi:hypothetical protein